MFWYMVKNYFKIAWRNLRINRTYATLNILGLGLGMAGAILIFLFLQYHLSTDRHQPNFDKLYRLVLDLHLDGGTEFSSDSSLPLSVALSMDYSQIEKVGFIQKMPDATLSSCEGKNVKRYIEKDNVTFANQEFVDMFDFQMLTGTKFNLLTEPNVAIISEKTARKYFASTDVIGKKLRINNATNLRITGVIKEQQHATDLNFEVYISLPTLKKIEPNYELDNFGWISSRNKIYIQLADGAEPKSVEKLIKANGTKYYDNAAKYYEHRLQPLSETHFDERYGGEIRHQILCILTAVGLFLLIIACINFINLATAQALKRSKEIGIRKMLGSSQRQIFWQFISETALQTVAAAILALIFVALLLPLLRNWTHVQAFHFKILYQFQLLAFWLMTIGTVIVLAGFYPSVIISGFNPIAALKGKLGMQRAGGIGLRSALITFQLIIAQVLAIGTLVLILQLEYFNNADLGFDKNAVLAIALPDSVQQNRTALKNHLLQFPDIKSVTYQYGAPSSNMGHGGSVKFDNRTEWEKFVTRERYGDEDYLDTYKMQLVAGRSYADRESVSEFVVNEEFMRKLGIADPQQILGKVLRTGLNNQTGEIVGVVKSFHLKSLQSATEPCAIFARPEQYKELAIKLNTTDFHQTLATVQDVWQKIYPDEVFSYQFVDDQIAKFYEKEEQLTRLIQSFAMVGIGICCLGLYGMVSFMVVQRTKEIGVRKVLGAGVDSIIVLFGKEFVVLVVLAFVVAAPLSWHMMSSWLNGFAYRIDLQWWILFFGGASVLIISLMTVGYKVLKAALMDPVKSLRME
jgi:putative ABC transport system permease protein